MAKLGNRLLQPLPLAVVLSVALRMPLTFGVKLQSRLMVVLLAMLTLAPARMSASVQRAFPSFEKEVVSSVGTHDEVAGAIVVADMIGMVDFFGPTQIPAQSAFDYEDMLEHIALMIRIRVTGHSLVDVSPLRLEDSTLPIRVVLQCLSGSVTLPHEQEIALANAVAATSPSPLRDGCRKPTTASTNARRIYHNRAPNVCADSFNQFNTFRRLT